MLYADHALYVSGLITCANQNKLYDLCYETVCIAHSRIPLRMSSLVGVRVCAVSFLRVCGLKTTVNMPKRAKKNEEAVDGEADNGTGTVH